METSSEKPKMLVVGLGEIGYNNCEYLSRFGFNVDGYDIDDKAIQRALSAKIIQKKATNFNGYDFYVICVSTHNPKNIFEPSLNGFFDVLERLAHEGKYGSLVTIESTITKGTSQKANNIINHRLHLAHAPHRFYSSDKELHGIKQTRVLGGYSPCCTAEALYFYQELLNIPMHVVSNIELAELSKIIENSYRFMQIAFAEEVKMFCDFYSIDFVELREAINTKWNIELLKARKGIGGHCLPKDSQMYLKLLTKIFSSPIISSAIISDKHYKHYIQNLIVSKEDFLIPQTVV